MSDSLLTRYWRAQDPYDPEGLARCRHPDWSANWPQSAEHIPNNEADVQIHSHYPGYPRHEQAQIRGEPEVWALSPSFTPIRIVGTGDVWVGEMRLDYPNLGRYHGALIMELEDGLVRRETAYFAESFGPPAWRADLVDVVPHDAPPAGSDLVIQAVSVHGDPDTQAASLRRLFELPLEGGTHADQRRRYQEAMRGLYDESAEQILVQSGERIRGLDRMLALVDRHPDFPKAGRLRRITPIGDVCVLEGRLEYDQGAFWEVMIVEFRDGRAVRSTEYYAAETEPPTWRSRWVERM
jgi:hypothetical protein